MSMAPADVEGQSWLCLDGLLNEDSPAQTLGEAIRDGEDFIGALRHAMQKVDDNIVNRRSIPFALLHGHLQVELRFALLM